MREPAGVGDSDRVERCEGGHGLGQDIPFDAGTVGDLP